MPSKAAIWIGLTIGSWVGAYIPTFFGADMLSGWSIVFSALGAFAGMYVGYKLSEGYF